MIINNDTVWWSQLMCLAFPVIMQSLHTAVPHSQSAVAWIQCFSDYKTVLWSSQQLCCFYWLGFPEFRLNKTLRNFYVAACKSIGACMIGVSMHEHEWEMWGVSAEVMLESGTWWRWWWSQSTIHTSSSQPWQSSKHFKTQLEHLTLNIIRDY